MKTIINKSLPFCVCFLLCAAAVVETVAGAALNIAASEDDDDDTAASTSSRSAQQLLRRRRGGSQQPQEREDQQEKPRSRDWGETQDTKKKYPFFVHVGQCGGSLIAPDVVLTAAHCANSIRDTVLVGAVNYWHPRVGNAQTRRVLAAHTVKHPHYNDDTKAYDFMLLKIQRVTKKHLKPVKLNPTYTIPSSSPLTVMGMGSLNTQLTKYEPHLRYTQVNAVSHSTCSKKFGPGAIHQDAMLCAWADGRDSCSGDSGGPLIDSDGVQVGVVSHGVTCADPVYPAVYSRISGAIGWIQKTACELSDANPDFCTNTNGVDRTTTSYSTQNSDITYSVTIQYDNQPQYVGWNIREISSLKKVVDMPRGSEKNPGSKITTPITLKPLETYALVITDTKKNGLKKGKTKGYVNIVAKRNGKIVWNVKVNGNFRFKKTTSFIVPSL